MKDAQGVSVKEALVTSLMGAGYDMFTACEDADRVIADCRRDLKPGQTEIYYPRHGGRGVAIRKEA